MAAYTKDQVALACIAEGKRRGITPRGIKIALATELVESNLTVYANNKVPDSLNYPHDAVGSDSYSVGPFQQQVVMGNGWWWGDAKTCMDPTTSAGLFFERLVRYDYNSAANSPGWYAAEIQQPAAQYRGRYDERYDEASALYDRLVGSSPETPGPSPFRVNVDATKEFIRVRVGNPYVYGGALSLNVRQGTDCSEVWQSTLEMSLGRWKQGRQSEGATTESYRPIPVGGVGPFGTIRVARPEDVPADAAARIALHHGPGGGANSHMWGELDGMRIESAGSKGLVTGSNARAFTDSYGTAWCYLPGPIDSEDRDPLEELLMSNLEVESWSIYATPGEPNIPILNLLRAIDKRSHEEGTETDAELGDIDALDRIARTAAGLGKYKDHSSVAHAQSFLTRLETEHPTILRAYIAAKGQA